jgi:hypothetical protein
MVYKVCIILEVQKTTPSSYPFREVILIRKNIHSPLSFPEYSGTFSPDTAEFIEPEPILQSILDSLPSIGDYSDKLKSTKIIDNFIFITIPNSKPNIPSPSSPEYLSISLSSHFFRVIMDEVLRGKYNHIPIVADVQKIFFVPSSNPNSIKPSNLKQYVSLIERNLFPTSFALVMTSPDDSFSPRFNDSYLPFPLIGYHGTSETSISRLLNPDIGFQPTLTNGMYGNNVYYFGSFFKAIRYAFRDSQYAVKPLNGSLQLEEADSIQGGFIEMPNSVQLLKSTDSTHNIVADLIRNSPAIVRFVLFPGSISVLPDDRPPSTIPKDKPSILNKELPIGTRGGFTSFQRKFPPIDVTSDDYKTFSTDYLLSQKGIPLFTPSDSLESFDISPLNNLSLKPNSSRQNAVLKVYKALHMAQTLLSPDSSPPFAVIILKAPGELPDLAGFSLFTSGFLTNGVPILGSTISYIPEEKVRSLMAEYRSVISSTNIIINGVPDLEQSAHRLVMEDIVRIAPKNAHLLLESYSLPPECLERIGRILLESGRQLILFRAQNESPPLPSPSQPFLYSTDELKNIHKIIDINVGNFEEIGGKVYTIHYSPIKNKGGTIRIGSRTCEIFMDDSIETTKSGKRIQYKLSGRDIEDYLAEYPRTGGSVRIYPYISPDGKMKEDFKVDDILPILWKDETADTLFVKPFRILQQSRESTDSAFNITSHNEIVIRNPGAFLPISWHRGDLRSLTRHHIPMSVSQKVL